MGHAICGTTESAKHWLNWSCSGLVICVIIHGIFLFSHTVVSVVVVDVVFRRFT